nr:TNT domain-containing protein [Actinomycetota bacterium]
VVAGYHPLAGLTPQQFITTYWDPSANGGKGGWRFPPDNGFLIGHNGQPEEMPLSLAPGQRIDRFGSEFGAFLAPINTPYASRALPPQSLDNFDVSFVCNYHLYKVLKVFTVEAGPIAPGFGQRGLGRQYQVVSSLVPGSPMKVNVMWLLDHGFLQRLNG